MAEDTNTPVTEKEEQGFFSKAIDYLKNEYIDYIKKDSERLLERKDSYIPGNLPLTGLPVPFPIRKAVFDALDKTTDEETKELWGDFKKSPVGQIDVGIQKGGADLTSAILKLGGMAVDATTEEIDEQFGTDISTKTLDILEKVVPDIKADSTLGEVTALVSQFAIPQAAVFRIGNALFKAKKLNLLPTLTAKAAEIGKRAAVYAPLEFAAGFTAVDPARLKSASEHFGFIDEYDSTLSGADQAKEDLQKRLAFGLESATLAGVAPAFPLLAGKVLGLTGKTAAVGFQGIQKVAGIALDNPVARFVGSSKYSPLALGARAIQKVDMKTIGLPPFNEWRQYSTRSTTPLQSVLGRIDGVLSYFRQEGVLAPVFKNLMVNSDNAINSELRFFNKKIEEIGDEITKIGYRFQKSFFDKGESLAIIDQNKTSVFKFLAGETKITSLDKALREPALAIRKRLTDLTKRFSGVVSKKEIANALFKEADNYLVQGYTSFNNQFYKPSEDAVKKATEYFKKLILRNADLKNLIIQRTGATKATTKDAKFMKGLAEEAKNMVDDVIATAKGNYNGKAYTPEQILNRIAKDYLRIDKPDLIRINQQLPGVIKDLLGRSNAFENAVIDTAMQAAKAVYGKQMGDAIFEQGIKGGWLYTSKDAPRILKGIKGGEFTEIKPSPTSLFAQGKVFTEGVFAAKPIAMALMDMDKKLISAFNWPIYKQIMAVKSGAQYAKTILSPVTQVRNVTSGPMFILNAGLYGSKANILDSIRIIKQDLFPKGTNSKEFLDYIEDAVARGILDENIMVNELKFILDQTKRTDLTADGFIKIITESKFGKKATDVYQAGDNLWKVWADKSYQDIFKKAVGYQEVYDKAGKVVSSKVNMKEVEAWYRDIAQTPFVKNSIKTGTAKTPLEIIKEMSAFYVTNVIPTYSKTPAAIGVIRQLPVGNFVAFPAEIMRTSMRNLQFAARELASDNAVLRQNGMKRLFGTMATNYGLYNALAAVGSAVTGISQDMVNAYRRSVGPTYQRNGDLIAVGGITEPGTGNFKIVDNSYYNPYSVNRRGVTALLNAFAEGKLTKENAETIIMNAFFGNPLTGTPGSLQEWFGSYFEESLAPERLLDIFVRGGETRTGRKIFYPNDNTMEKIDKSLLHIFGAMEPGGLTTGKRVYRGVTQEFTKYGSQINLPNELIKITTGISIQETRPLDSLPFMINSFNKDQKNLDQKYRGEMLAANTNARQKVESFKNYVLDQYRAQNIFKMNKDDLLKMKVFPDYIEEKLQDRYNENDVFRIMNNQFKSPNTPSEDAIKGYTKNVLDKMPISERVREEIKLEAALDTMKQIKDEINDSDLGGDVSKLEDRINRIIKMNEPFLREGYQTPSFRREEMVPTDNKQSSIPNLGPGIVDSPPVNPQVVSVVNPLAGLIQGTGLTATENALLSPAEQAIRLRQRGIG